ncbi:TIGR04104 family putative zinc finger protein [Anaerobacillus arseniciselenatis]|uniref:TIGR04104 family putative zinc finger protein n=1 Tax=Anaerobacillus arseniciselenatis TaxID=85682 RepID=UPI003B5B2B2F
MCKKQFSWREIGKSTSNLFIRPKVECSNCDQEYKITISSYIVAMLLRSILILVTFFVIKIDYFSNGINIIIFLVSVAIIFFIEPYLVKYKKIEK